MKKLNKLAVAGMAAILFATNMAGTTQAAYSIDHTYAFNANQGSSQVAQNMYLILHETDNARATGANEAANMKNNYTPYSAYSTFVVGDGGKVYQIGEPGYVAYAAGNANGYSPVQIELQHTTDPSLFAKNYAVYIELARDMANKYGIPLTLDAGGAGTRGIKSHLWITQNIWGSHYDPYSYLAQMGVSKAKLANDLANGTTSVGGNDNPAPTNPAPTTPSNQNEWTENWHFTNGDQPIQARLGTPSLSAPYAGKLPAWTTIYYDRVAVREGYVWCHWTTNNGDSVWMPVHPVGTANNVWVFFN
ncbi:SH3 domain-containing protein [Latilactobacillus sakei]|uniref:SH3 domain-containing protein n=1 Tax=Latilactobacillus sakei TaxID=1599 RepID=UPI0035B5F2B5